MAEYKALPLYPRDPSPQHTASNEFGVGLGTKLSLITHFSSLVIYGLVDRPAFQG